MGWILDHLWRFGQCSGCLEWRCPKVGPFLARRREHAYCPDCMLELYR